MTRAGRHSPEPGDTRTPWPWMLPEGAPGTPLRRHARYGDGAWLAALVAFWGDRYTVSIRRRLFRKEWLAVRTGTSRDPLRARDHAALSQALYADWLAETALEAQARVAAEEAAAAEKAPAVPVAVFQLPPDADCVSPASMTRMQLPVRGRPYLGDRDAS